MYSRLSRYQNVESGSTYGNRQILIEQYDVQVNFDYHIIGGDLIYLFDRGRTLFAICDKTTKKTHMFNLKNARKIFNQYENKCNGYTIKPGDIVIHPATALHIS